MPGKVPPGVIFKSRFVFSKQKFSNYINYIDRPEAVRNIAYNLYSDYVGNYMDNPQKQPGPLPEKTSALFTATHNRLTPKEKEELKKQFRVAQEADSPMWQQVISFTNDFLKQHGLYNPESRQLDEGKIREVTRAAVQEMLKNEHMNGTAVWSASIHYNTDNIHVHIAVVEPHPTLRKKDFEGKKQYRAAMKRTTFSKVKSKIVNGIIDRSEQLKEINGIIRDNIVADKRSSPSSKDRLLRGAFLNLYSRLPKDRRLWQYNMNALHELRPDIDRFSRMYVQMYHLDDLKQLSSRLTEQQDFLKSVYGSGKQELYKNYSSNKMKELYTRMGNAVLKELREYDKTVRKLRSRPRGRNPKERLRHRKSLSKSYAAGWYNLRRAMNKNFENVKNMVAYQKLENEIERSDRENEI